MSRNIPRKHPKESRMRLVCLGTTGYHPNATRHTACYYLPELGVLLDAGTGIFRLTSQLIEEPRKQLDILLSHAHLDHVVGLSFLLDTMAVTELESVDVYGTADKISAVREHLFHPLLFPVLPNFRFHELNEPPGHLQLANSHVKYFPLEHPGGSIGFLIEADSKRLAYITDTTPLSLEVWSERLTDLDLLLHECYFGDDQAEFAMKTGHSWLSAVTDLVARIRPKQTLLIHVNPQSELFGQPFELTDSHHALGIRLAEDLMAVDF
jgi:ribonuclease Z